MDWTLKMNGWAVGARGALSATTLGLALLLSTATASADPRKDAACPNDKGAAQDKCYEYCRDTDCNSAHPKDPKRCTKIADEYQKKAGHAVMCLPSPCDGVTDKDARHKCEDYCEVFDCDGTPTTKPQHCADLARQFQKRTGHALVCQAQTCPDVTGAYGSDVSNCAKNGELIELSGTACDFTFVGTNLHGTGNGTQFSAVGTNPSNGDPMECHGTFSGMSFTMQCSTMHTGSTEVCDYQTHLCVDPSDPICYPTSSAGGGGGQTCQVAPVPSLCTCGGGHLDEAACAQFAYPWTWDPATNTCYFAVPNAIDAAACQQVQTKHAGDGSGRDIYNLGLCCVGP